MEYRWFSALAQAWTALMKKRRKGKKAAAAADETAAVGLESLRLQLVSTGQALERALQVGFSGVTRTVRPPC